MINISKIVKELLEDDTVALDAMNRGYMNYSSYARQIKPRVEENLYQTVSEKSITVALSRIAKKLIKSEEQISPKVLNLSLHVDFAEVSYDKTHTNIIRLEKIRALSLKDPKSFFTSTSGINEITIVGEINLIKRIENEIMNTKPSYKQYGLSGITIRFPLEHLDVPGILVKLVNQVSKKRINLIEVISTNTELTLFVEKKDAETAIAQLSKLL